MADLRISVPASAILTPESIARVEGKYNATFVADLTIKGKYGWVENPVAVFWQPEPPQEGYSNYFAIFFRDGMTYITGAGCVAENPWDAGVADDGEIIFSRYRHNFLYSQDGSIFVDGGRDYFRGSRSSVRIKLVGPKFVLVAEGEDDDNSQFMEIENVRV